jgi:dTDP-4-amino-4,6-dideoxygalactose transaminase
MGVFQDGRSEVPGGLKNAEDASAQVLSLLIEPLQREEETAYVVKCIGEFCRNVSISVGTGSDKQV